MIFASTIERGKKVGGQSGHKGSSMKMVQNPDFIESHHPSYCNCCGHDLSRIAPEYTGKRQVVDIPEIELTVTEHRVYKKSCHCGHVTQGTYPKGRLGGAFTKNLGLMYGKMGISICFFHLFKQSEITLFKTFTEELIDEIYDEITVNISNDFENGLAGIGWGLEYLIQERFIDGDSEEVLEDVDCKLFDSLANGEIDDLGLLNGVLRIGFYFLKRIEGSKNLITTNVKSNKYLSVLNAVLSYFELSTKDLAEILKEHKKKNLIRGGPPFFKGGGSSINGPQDLFAIIKCNFTRIMG